MRLRRRWGCVLVRSRSNQTLSQVFVSFVFSVVITPASFSCYAAHTSRSVIIQVIRLLFVALLSFPITLCSLSSFVFHPSIRFPYLYLYFRFRTHAPDTFFASLLYHHCPLHTTVLSHSLTVLYCLFVIQQLAVERLNSFYYLLVPLYCHFVSRSRSFFGVGGLFVVAEQ